jgi:hypothetical protein
MSVFHEAGRLFWRSNSSERFKGRQRPLRDIALLKELNQGENCNSNSSFYLVITILPSDDVSSILLLLENLPLNFIRPSDGRLTSNST